MIPAQFQVLVTRRPRYACRRCSQAVVQAHAPEHVVPGGLPTERLIAWIIVSKFGDHLPFYRQAGIFERQGLHLDRGTLGNWVGRACFHLLPIIDHMKANLRAADRIFVDETRAPVLDPGRKTTKSGYFWAVVSDDRGHGGAGPPIVLFHYAPGRGREPPLRFLAGYRGRFLQCDTYQSYNALTEITRDTGPWQLVYRHAGSTNAQHDNESRLIVPSGKSHQLNGRDSRKWLYEPGHPVRTMPDTFPDC